MTTDTGRQGVASARSGPEGVALRATPAWRVVLKEQGRLLYLKQRRTLVGLAAAAALASLLRLTEVYASSSVTVSEMLLGSPLYALVLLAALFWATAVWSDEGPGDRAYHWSLPVRRPVHDATRTGVGAGWFVAVVLTGFVVGMTLVALAWGRTTVLARPGVAVLMVLGVLLAYLLGSVAAVASEHPHRWILWSFFGFLLARMMATAASERWPALALVRDGLAAIWSGPYGLEVALTAGHHVAHLPVEKAAPDPVAALLLWLFLVGGSVAWVLFLRLERAKGAAE